MKALIILAALSALGSSPTRAQAATTCTSATAVSTSVGEIEKDYKAWRGRCVAVSGMVFKEKLYADRQSFLIEDHDIYDRHATPFIVVYPSDAGGFRRTPMQADVVGVVGSCADENEAVEGYGAAHPDELVMTGGYCHTSMNDYVRPVVVDRHAQERIVRFTQSELAPAQWELVEAPADLPRLGEQVTAATGLAQALADGDAHAFGMLTMPDVADELAKAKGKPLESWVIDRMADSRTDFTKARRIGTVLKAILPLATAQSRTLISSRELARFRAPPKAGDEAPSEFYLTTCWCRTTDCTGRWPVLNVDADNLPSRPYACVETSGYLLGPGEATVIAARAEVETEGFGEPD